MIRINIYSVLDKTVVQLHILRPDLGTKARPHPVEYLFYDVYPPVAHDETGCLIDYVTDALERTTQDACERGGWSVLT